MENAFGTYFFNDLLDTDPGRQTCSHVHLGALMEPENGSHDAPFVVI
jgi:hypothetical protein